MLGYLDELDILEYFNKGYSVSFIVNRYYVYLNSKYFEKLNNGIVDKKLYIRKTDVRHMVEKIILEHITAPKIKGTTSL